MAEKYTFWNMCEDAWEHSILIDKILFVYWIAFTVFLFVAGQWGFGFGGALIVVLLFRTAILEFALDQAKELIEDLDKELQRRSP